MPRILPSMLLMFATCAVAWSHEGHERPRRPAIKSSETETIELPLPQDLDDGDDEGKVPEGRRLRGDSVVDQDSRPLKPRTNGPRPEFATEDTDSFTAEPECPWEVRPTPKRRLHGPHSRQPRLRQPCQRDGARHQEYCPVSGHRLGAFGRPIALTNGRTTVYTCSEPCASVVERFPEIYIECEELDVGIECQDDLLDCPQCRHLHGHGLLYDD